MVSKAKKQETKLSVFGKGQNRFHVGRLPDGFTVRKIGGGRQTVSVKMHVLSGILGQFPYRTVSLLDSFPTRGQFPYWTVSLPGQFPYWTVSLLGQFPYRTVSLPDSFPTL